MTTFFLITPGILLAALILFTAFQRRLIYRRRAQSSPARLSLRSIGGERVEIETADGQRLSAWHKPPSEGRPIVVFFHGSADDPDHRAVRFMNLISGNFGVFAPHLRGYGKSTGTPSEDGLHRDAEAIYQFCLNRYTPDRIVLWGFSLGSAVATRLASTNKVAAIVLEAAFPSLVKVAKYWVSFFPISFFLIDRFETERSIRSVQAPILMIHGTADRNIPIDLGRQLFELAPEPKKFVRIDGGGHDDLDKYGATTTVRTFLARLFDPRDKA